MILPIARYSVCDIRDGVRRALGLSLCLLALVGLASCASAEVTDLNDSPASTAETTDQRQDVVRRLEIAEAKWKAANIRDYQYLVKRKCSFLCQETVNVVVSDRKCRKVSAPGIEAMIACEGMTIPEQLASIRRWANDDSGSSIRVVFNEKFGYPTEFFVQTNNPEEFSTTRIEGFTALK